MLRIQRYLLGELLTSFALVLLLCTGIFLGATLLRALHQAPELSIFALLSGTPVFLALTLPITVPLSFLIACLLSYGRFADDNEMLALQMGGLSPWHAVAPAVCAAAVLSIGTLELSADISPILKSSEKAILRVQAREQVELMRTTTQTSVNINDMEMSWSRREGDWFRDVLLTWTTTRTSPDGEKIRTTQRTQADRARVALTDGTPLRLAITLEGMSSPGDTTYAAKSQKVYFDIDEDTSKTEVKRKDEMRAAELYYRMTRLASVLPDASRKTTDPRAFADEWRQYRLFAGEYWRRVAFGFSPLAFALVGVPIGLLVRRGSRAQALIIALFIVLPVYYPLLLVGDNLSRLGAMPPALALNLANLLLGTVGCILVARLVTR